MTIEVSPWGFDLPREQAMATAFMFYSSAVLAGHAALSAALSGAEAPPPPANLPRDYVHLLARYGISVGRLYEGSPASRNPDGSLTFDWTGFDSSVGAALDGTLFPDAPPATSFAVPDLPPDCTPGQRKAFYAEVVAHMREKGWLSRMYSYVSDEPTRADYPAVHAIAAEIKGFDPGIRTLLTEPWVSELSDVIDIWVVDLPYIGDSVPVMPVSARWPFRFSLDWQINPRPSRYLAARDAGQASWIYTCDSSVFLDYPNLFIDADAAAARVIPWLAFRYGFTGLLYWNVLSHYTGNPWVDQYGFMANGDGDLLYPGVPGLPDIHEHSPIPSLRLQLLRDGFEDYQYLALLGQAQGAESAREIAAEVARSSLAWAHYTADIERVREQVAEALTRR